MRIIQQKKTVLGELVNTMSSPLDMEPRGKKNVAVCFRSGGTCGRAIGSNPHVRGMTPLQHKAAASSVLRLDVNNDIDNLHDFPYKYESVATMHWNFARLG